MSAVAYRGVEKRFGDVVALHALDLDAPDGTFLVLLGPSGCGKTTALRILAGLELPTAGTVHIGDRDVTRIQPRDRDVAMVFQSYALYPHMTVSENIAYPLKVRGLDRKQRAAAVAQVAELLEVTHLLDRRPRQLSGGQRQRIALARAIVREPHAFLMDEPLSNLDARLRLTMRGEIKRLQKRLATTTLYVTHDQSEAMTMADHVAVLRDGALQQVGSPSQIYDMPANRFVAAFVGNPPTNILDGELDCDGHAFVIDGGRVALDDARFRSASAGAARAIGLRPEDLTLVPAGTTAALQGEVYVVEPMGAETLVDVTLGSARVTVRTERGYEAPIGTAVGVVVSQQTASFFNADGVAVAHRSDRRPTGAEETVQ